MGEDMKMLEKLEEHLLRRQLKKALKKTNFELTAAMIMNQMSDVMLEDRLTELLDDFIDYPDFDTAVPLLIEYPYFLSFFEFPFYSD